MLRLSAQRILDVVYSHLHPREAVRHGQVAWTAIAVEHRPTWRQPVEQMKLVPLVLDLVIAEDVDAIIDREPWRRRLLRRSLRLCQQAYEQGGLLSSSDLSLLLGINASEISKGLVKYEREQKTLVPRRATLHDVGTGLTHKRLICWKRYGEGLTSEQIARETYHSIEAVDRYLGQFDRVRHCLRQGLSEAEIAYVLSCSRSLVAEYAAIDRDLRKPSAALAEEAAEDA
jgi:DNA-binding CsgD family transcriptional regulator